MKLQKFLFKAKLLTNLLPGNQFAQSIFNAVNKAIDDEIKEISLEAVQKDLEHLSDIPFIYSPAKKIINQMKNMLTSPEVEQKPQLEAIDENWSMLSEIEQVNQNLEEDLANNNTNNNSTYSTASTDTFDSSSIYNQDQLAPALSQIGFDHMQKDLKNFPEVEELIRFFENKGFKQHLKFNQINREKFAKWKETRSSLLNLLENYVNEKQNIIKSDDLEKARALIEQAKANVIHPRIIVSALRDYLKNDLGQLSIFTKMVLAENDFNAAINQSREEISQLNDREYWRELKKNNSDKAREIEAIQREWVRQSRYATFSTADLLEYHQNIKYMQNLLSETLQELKEPESDKLTGLLSALGIRIQPNQKNDLAKANVLSHLTSLNKILAQHEAAIISSFAKRIMIAKDEIMNIRDDEGNLSHNKLCNDNIIHHFKTKLQNLGLDIDAGEANNHFTLEIKKQVLNVIKDYADKNPEQPNLQEMKQLALFATFFPDKKILLKGLKSIISHIKELKDNSEEDSILENLESIKQEFAICKKIVEKTDKEIKKIDNRLSALSFEENKLLLDLEDQIKKIETYAQHIINYQSRLLQAEEQSCAVIPAISLEEEKAERKKEKIDDFNQKLTEYYNKLLNTHPSINKLSAKQQNAIKKCVHINSTAPFSLKTFHSQLNDCLEKQEKNTFFLFRWLYRSKTKPFKQWINSSKFLPSQIEEPWIEIKQLRKTAEEFTSNKNNKNKYVATQAEAILDIINDYANNDNVLLAKEALQLKEAILNYLKNMSIGLLPKKRADRKQFINAMTAELEKMDILTAVDKLNENALSADDVVENIESSSNQEIVEDHLVEEVAPQPSFDFEKSFFIIDQAAAAVKPVKSFDESTFELIEADAEAIQAKMDQELFDTFELVSQTDYDSMIPTTHSTMSAVIIDNKFENKDNDVTKLLEQNSFNSMHTDNSMTTDPVGIENQNVTSAQNSLSFEDHCSTSKSPQNDFTTSTTSMVFVNLPSADKKEEQEEDLFKKQPFSTSLSGSWSLLSFELNKPSTSNNNNNNDIDSKKGNSPKNRK